MDKRKIKWVNHKGKEQQHTHQILQYYHLLITTAKNFGSLMEELIGALLTGKDRRYHHVNGEQGIICKCKIPVENNNLYNE